RQTSGSHLTMGSGADSVRLAATSGQMDSVQGRIIVNGSGATTLTVNDSGTSNTDRIFHNVQYTIVSGALERRDTVGSSRPILISTQVSFSSLAELRIRAANRCGVRCAQQFRTSRHRHRD